LNAIIKDLLEQNKGLKHDNSKITKKYKTLKENPPDNFKIQVLETQALEKEHQHKKL
jgi:hypothetical protein